MLARRPLVGLSREGDGPTRTLENATSSHLASPGFLETPPHGQSHEGSLPALVKTLFDQIAVTVAEKVLHLSFSAGI